MINNIINKILISDLKISDSVSLTVLLFHIVNALNNKIEITVTICMKIINTLTFLSLI
jgi:hypothetical protein